MYKENRVTMSEIQTLRERMIQSAYVYGMNSERTIKCSQELDELIFKFQLQQKEEQGKLKEVRLVKKQMIFVWPKSYHLA